MELLKDFGMFIYNTLMGFLGLGVTFITFYAIIYFIIRIFCCGNSKSDYKQYRKYMNTSFLNYIRCLYELSTAHLDSAKLHAENIMLRNKEARKSRDSKSRRDGEIYE